MCRWIDRQTANRFYIEDKMLVKMWLILILRTVGLIMKKGQTDRHTDEQNIDKRKNRQTD